MGTETVSPVGLQAVIVLVAPFLLQWLKTARWFPWLTRFSDGWLRFWSIAVAVLASVGIGITWDGPAGRLVIDGLHWDALLALGLQVALHFTGQEGLYRLVIKPRAKIGLVLAIGLAAGTSTACASLTPAPITNPALQSQEAQVAAIGLDIITEARAFGPAYEKLVVDRVITPELGLTLVRIERTIANAARGLYDALGIIATARRYTSTAQELAGTLRAQWAAVGSHARELLGAGDDAVDAVESPVARTAIRAVVRRIRDHVFRLLGAAPAPATGGAQ
jgi:hypothetical protein